MLSLLNFVIAIIDISLLVYVITSPTAHLPNVHWRKVFVCALLCGMAYDNLIVASGYWFIEQSWYTAVSLPRFYLHVLILPFLSLFTCSICRDSGIALGKNQLFVAVCTLLTLGALTYGVSHELMNLQLVENSSYGIRRMSNANGSAPMATILTNLFTLIVAAYLWRKTGWSGLFVGTLFIFAVNAASASQKWGFIAGNLAEIVFVVSLIFTHRHFSASALPAHKQVSA